MGASATGGRKGTSNKNLMDLMPDIRCVADLDRLRSAKAPSPVQLIMKAMTRLESRRIIPPSARAPERSVSAACAILHEEACARGGDQHLLKVLWQRQKAVPELQPFVALVIRLWLISPPESVVESMGSVIQVFGAHRQLDRANAAKELLIRWNGPELSQADPLIKAVQRRCGLNFQKRSGGITGAFEGTVISRHRGMECARSHVYRAATDQ